MTLVMLSMLIGCQAEPTGLPHDDAPPPEPQPVERGTVAWKAYGHGTVTAGGDERDGFQGVTGMALTIVDNSGGLYPLGHMLCHLTWNGVADLEGPLPDVPCEECEYVFHVVHKPVIGSMWQEGVYCWRHQFSWTLQFGNFFGDRLYLGIDEDENRLFWFPRPFDSYYPSVQWYPFDVDHDFDPTTGALSWSYMRSRGPYFYDP